MLLEISAAVAAASLVVLVWHCVRTLRAVCATLKQVNRTLRHIRMNADRIGGQAHKVLRQTEEIADRVHANVRQLEPLVQSAGTAGEWIVVGIQWLKAWGARKNEQT